MYYPFADLQMYGLNGKDDPFALFICMDRIIQVNDLHVSLNGLFYAMQII